MFDIPIPNQWIKAKLPEIADLNMGQSPSNHDVNEIGEGIAFFQGKAEFGKLIPTVRKFCTAPRKVAQANDILLSVRAPVGPTNLADRATAIGRGLAAISVSKDNFYYKYLLHYFRNIEPWMSKQGTGTTFKAISGQFLQELDCIVPPFAEQKVIANKLDTLLEQVETIKAHLDHISEILKSFRQSVLVAAVNGKLTEGWRGHESYAKNGYPDNWIELGLSDVGELARGKSKHRPRNDPRLFGNKYPFIQTGEIANSNGYILDAKQYYSEFGLSQSKLFPKGTLCITIAANIADTSILGIDACFPDSVVGFTPDPEKCEVLFVKYLIDINKSNLEDFAPATAQKNINLKILNAMKLPFPSLKEQAEIVHRVEELFAFADHIKQKTNAALKRVNSLTQSILAKAFRGELTADWRAANSELISGENSAETLLKKIKAEREAIKNKPKRSVVKKNTGSHMGKQIIKVVEALKQAGEPLSGQRLLAAAGYPDNSNTEELELFFLDLRDALAIEKSIVKLERNEDGQDWFALAKADGNE